MGDMKEVRADPTARIVKQADIDLAKALGMKAGSDGAFWVLLILTILKLEGD